jgi:hypothetical protein
MSVCLYVFLSFFIYFCSVYIYAFI